MHRKSNILGGIVVWAVLLSCGNSHESNHSQSQADSNHVPIAATRRCADRVSDSLGTTLASQATDNWCWAACTEMVLQGFQIVDSQCNIANCLSGRRDCCGPHLPRECDIGGWPPFGCYNLEADSTVNSAISWDEVKNQISCRQKAFCFSWLDVDSDGNVTEAGHIMVASGYKTVGGVKQIKMLDPYPPHEGNERWIDYDDNFKENSYHVHWKDLYNVRIKVHNE